MRREAHLTGLILLIARKRLALNLVSGRFVFVTLLLLATMLGSSFVWQRRLSEQRELYEAARAKEAFAIDDARYYEQVRLGLHKPPEPLSVWASGAGELFGSSVLVSGKYGSPRITAREKFEAGSHLDAPDFSRLVILLIGLLALLLSYDTICGEREDGILQLCVAQPASRLVILLGEYAGCVVTLVTPLLLAVAAVLAIHLPTNSAALSREEWVRVGLIVLASAVFGSALIWMGLTISAAVRQSSTAFAVAFVLWVALAILSPNVSLWVAQRMRPIPPSQDSLSSDGVFGLRREGPEETASPERQVESQLRDEALRRKFEQAAVNDFLRLWTPTGAFLALAQTAARTDVESHRNFLARGRALDAQLRAWQKEKLRLYPERETFYKPSWGPLDISGLPASPSVSTGLDASLTRTGRFWAALICFNGIFAAASAVAFARYDVRFQ